jgi:hypothetical protein
MAFSRRFVQGLRVQQLPSHLDLQLLFSAMEHSPASLSVSYGQRCVGMDYDRAAFGASLADCRCVLWDCCCNSIAAFSTGGSKCSTAPPLPSRAELQESRLF